MPRLSNRTKDWLKLDASQAKENVWRALTRKVFTSNDGDDYTVPDCCGVGVVTLNRYPDNSSVQIAARLLGAILIHLYEERRGKVIAIYSQNQNTRNCPRVLSRMGFTKEGRPFKNLRTDSRLTVYSITWAKARSLWFTQRILDRHHKILKECGFYEYSSKYYDYL